MTPKTKERKIYDLPLQAVRVLHEEPYITHTIYYKKDPEAVAPYQMFIDRYQSTPAKALFFTFAGLVTYTDPEQIRKENTVNVLYFDPLTCEVVSTVRSREAVHFLELSKEAYAHMMEALTRISYIKDFQNENSSIGEDN